MSNKPQKKPQQFEKDLVGAVINRKGDVADAVGMPDEKDYEMLLGIFKRYERQYPGHIQFILKQGRREFEEGKYAKNLVWKGKAEVNQFNNMTYVFELPPILFKRIEDVFPSIFRSKKHLGWFKRNFVKLTIGATER
jgi:hypothetical protein